MMSTFKNSSNIYLSLGYTGQFFRAIATLQSLENTVNCPIYKTVYKNIFVAKKIWVSLFWIQFFRIETIPLKFIENSIKKIKIVSKHNI